MNQKLEIIKDEDGNNIVVINNIMFSGRRNINWEAVEKYLKKYVGYHYEVLKTADKVYIGSDFPKEFKGSNDTKALRGEGIGESRIIRLELGYMVCYTTINIKAGGIFMSIKKIEVVCAA